MLPRRSEKIVFIAICAVLVLFGTFVLALRQAGFLRFSGTDASSKIVAAALALTGGFVGSAVSIIGILLKHSIDQRSEDRLDIEARRTASLQWEAEQRLKQEAAIRAVQLFSTNTGTPAPSIQRNGAIFALASLGQYDLMLSLVAELLQQNQLDPTTSSTLIERALATGEEALQNRAIDLLVAHASRMLTDGGAVLPESIVNWERDLTVHAREGAPIALGKVMAARPLKQWNQSHANVVVTALATAWSRLEDGYIKNDVGAILSCILEGLPPQEVISAARMTIHLKSVREEVAHSVPHSMAARELCDELTLWARTDQGA